MAVEAKKIKERLKVLYPGVNLSAKRMDELSAKLAKKPADDAEDEAIDGVINNANDFISFSDIAKDDDRVRNLEANQRKPNDPAPTDPPTPPAPTDPPAPPEDVPAWAKALIDANKTVTTELQELKAGKVTESKRVQAKKLYDSNEKLKSLKGETGEKWFNRIDVDSETPVADQIDALESELTDITQVQADATSTAGAPPNGSNNSKPTDADIDAVAAGL